MGKLAQMVEDNGRGSLPRENFGLPSLDLSDMQGVGVPVDYDIRQVMGDILMCEVADESPNGDINRGGVWIKQEVVTRMWRVAKVVKAGPLCSGVVKVGDHVMYPSDKGLPMIQHKKKYIFLNESRIFCTVGLV